MTSADRLEQDLPRILERLYVGPRPLYADDVLRVATRTPRSLGAPTLERWVPMTPVTGWIAATPRFPWRVVGLVALLAIALAAAALFVGKQPEKRPAPYGPAGNGLIAYEYAGNLYVGDPVTGQTTAITSRAGDRNPTFSPDGSRIAFLRSYAYYPELDHRVDVVTVRPDGAGLRVLTPERRSDIAACCAWTPDSTRVLADILVESDPEAPYTRLVAFDASRAGEPQALGTAASGLALDEQGCCGPGFPGPGPQVAAVLRPPRGDRILSLGDAWPRHTITEMNLDGGDARAVVTLEFYDLGQPAWSPDGSTIAFNAAVDMGGGPCGQSPCTPEWRAYLVNADGSGLRLLAPEAGPPPPGMVMSEANPLWSPDGSTIAVWRTFDRPDGPDCCPDAARLVLVDVATGAEREIEAAPGQGYVPGTSWSPDGLLGTSWSPDGRSLLISIFRAETWPYDQDATIMLDIETRQTTELPWPHYSVPSWQRLAP